MKRGTKQTSRPRMAAITGAFALTAFGLAGIAESESIKEQTDSAPLRLADDAVLEMGPVEQEVYRRVYEGKGGTWEHRTGDGEFELAEASLEDLTARTSFARWEIDPAEFSRNLERKTSELAAMREKYFKSFVDGATENALTASADKAMKDLKALASFYKNQEWNDVWQVGLLNPQRSADSRSVAKFLDHVDDALTGALRSELKKPSFPNSSFGRARSASHMYLMAEAFLRVHPDFEQKEPAAFKKLHAMMALLKDVTFQAWSYPHAANNDMRRKRPLQTATFRYHGGYTVGNFCGYRPLITCALVHNDTRMLDIVRDVVEKSISTKSGYFDVYESFWGDGFKSEGTMFAHGNQNYTFGYGKDYVRLVFNLADTLRGTVWEIDHTKWNGMVDMLLDGWQWYLHRGEREISIMGRNSLHAPSSIHPKASSGKAEGNRYILGGWYAAIMKHSKGEIARKAEFERMCQRMRANDDLIGNRYFWLSEDMLHHRKDQYICVNMSSTRIRGPEGAGAATMHNRLFGCGLTVLKRAADELDHIRGAWDYTALPGITFAEGDSYKHEYSYSRVPGDNIYSGGVSDGMNGICAFKYTQKGISLTINKSYFAFDNCFICLGSALQNRGKAAAWTTVNQCAAKTDVRLSVNGAERTFPRGQPVNIREQSDKPIAVWHDQMGYIVFPHNGQAEIILKVENRMTHWHDISPRNENVTEYPMDVLQLSIPHKSGDAQTNQGYRYAALFNVSPESLARKLDGGEIRILQNNGQTQAVKCGAFAGLVFLREGAFHDDSFGMSADRPAVLMLDNTEPNAVKLTYADPLLDPAARELVVTTNLAASDPAAKGGVLRLPLPRGPEVGKPATVRIGKTVR